MYKPERNNSQNFNELKVYVDKELRKIAGQLLVGNTDTLLFNKWTTIPPKPEEGLVAYADNTISGVEVDGLHIYSEGQWQLLCPIGLSGHWKDNVYDLTSAKSVGAGAPSYIPLNGSSYLVPDMTGSPIRRLQIAFHVNHDVKQNSYCWPHVHWTTNGTNSGLVIWRLSWQKALGHDQANFGTAVNIDIGTNIAPAAPWRHFIAEGIIQGSQAIQLTEPDELIVMTLELLSNTVPTDAICGLYVDLHYEAERDGTKNKAPNFYI